MAHRVAIIGLGIMGKQMLKNMMEDERFSVVAAYDLNPGQESEVKMVADAESLLRSEDIDLVYIATPPKTHVQYASLALDYKKAVLCEKPLSVNLEDAKALVKKANDSKLPNAVNFPFASKEIVKQIDETITRGEMGELLWVDIRCHFPKWPRAWQQAGNWLSERSDGGFVREVVSHFVYLTERLVGELELISSTLNYPNDESSEVYANARLQSGNILVNLLGTVGGASPDLVDWTLYGTNKSYRLLNWNQLQEGTLDGWQDITPANNQGNKLHMDAIAALVEGKPHPLADFEMGLRVQQTVEAILAS
jgi:1,5-anhydro-D-fructose reductase (1,5-anhydro-D-mannitol-forming)